MLGSITSADVTITDNDVIPTGVIRFDDKNQKLKEGDESVSLKVLRQGGSTGRIVVKYTTVNGTAVAGSDFTAVEGELVFEDGETEKTITIPLLNDTKKEHQENFSVKLSTLSANKILGEMSHIKISDDD